MSLKDIVKTGPDFDTFRMIIYGMGGIGKSTLASLAEKPIFLDIEGGLAGIDANSIPLQETDYMGFLESLKMLYEEDHDYKTLVVDSLDWLERVVHRHTCGVKKVDDIADLDWGKGYVAALGFMEQIINKFDKLRNHKKMNMILISHAATTKVEDPGVPEYQKWALQLHYKSAAKLFQWSDMCLFATYDVRTTKETGAFNKQRTLAHGGTRVLRTRDQPTHAAKNRIGLPDPMEMEWELIQEFINNAKKKGKQ